MTKIKDLNQRVDCYTAITNETEEKTYQHMGRFWASVKPTIRSFLTSNIGDTTLIKPEAIYQIIFRKNCFKNHRLNMLEKIDWNHRELFVLSLFIDQPHWIIALVCQKYSQNI